MKSRKAILTVGIILISVILTIIGWAVLPNTIVLQINTAGNSGTTLPKILGLAIPFLISTVSAILYYLRENRKHLLISVIGLVLFCFILLIN